MRTGLGNGCRTRALIVPVGNQREFFIHFTGHVCAGNPTHIKSTATSATPMTQTFHKMANYQYINFLFDIAESINNRRHYLSIPKFWNYYFLNWCLLPTQFESSKSPRSFSLLKLQENFEDDFAEIFELFRKVLDRFLKFLSIFSFLIVDLHPATTNHRHMCDSLIKINGPVGLRTL